ncbi:hypothetical protein LOD99_10326 [Oopsacas minuta]|uniref:G-protein coupled receptors family 1 profile domain-containing protein n=1 Tax=Oopsacas minuta TaxID=111878 RepID=A0AAV7KJD5_9METZ|nr:hypothetical protein LOD99_10326 [Oopsacas minuta]
MKDDRKEKLNSKLVNSRPEHVWLNEMQNYRTNRIKHIFLLAICLSEIGMTFSIISQLIYNEVSEIYFIQSTTGYGMEYLGDQLVYITGYVHAYGQIDSLVMNTIPRIALAVITISIYSIALFVRILTQFMVYQYSYFKSQLNLKFELYISLSCLIVLFIMAVVPQPQLIMMCNICIVMVVIYEYVLLLIANRKLCLLLKQRLSDAIQHENQSRTVILYYKTVYNDYKKGSIVMLIAFFAQYLGFSIYCINPVIIKIAKDSIILTANEALTLIKIDSYATKLELFPLILGTSIQILLYLTVSLRRTFRSIYHRIKLNNNISSNRSSLKRLIERNNAAYRMKM